MKQLTKRSLFHGKAPGNTSKFWFTPDGKLHDTGGIYHYRWAQRNWKTLKDEFGIDIGHLLESSDEDAVRRHLVAHGMTRVNHKARNNHFTVESGPEGYTDFVCEQLWDWILSHSWEIHLVNVIILWDDFHRAFSRSVDFLPDTPPRERGEILVDRMEIFRFCRYRIQSGVPLTFGHAPMDLS